jgi:hypothetical protein
LNQNPAYLLDCLVQVVVDDLVTIPLGLAQLAPGLRESPLDRPLGFGSPAAQPAFKLFQGTGPDEDCDRVSMLLHDAQRSLHVNP